MPGTTGIYLRGIAVLNNEENDGRLSTYLRTRYGGRMYHEAELGYLVAWSLSYEKDLDATRADNNRLRLENESLTAKNMALAGELLQKREQVDVLKVCVDALRKMVPDNG